jgi:tol-pal system protein YbgF
MLRLAPLCLGLLLLAAPGHAQSRAGTLADIRQELSVLWVEVQKLKRELSTTGAPNVQLPASGPLQRVDALEAEVRRLTARTEELEFRIQQIVADGTNRIGDLEYRLVELEGGDTSKLGQTSTLGGGALPAGPVAPAGPAAPAPGAEMAVGEQSDFDRARAALEAGDNAEAARLFAAFSETYPGGALSGEAHFLRGEALAATEDWRGAARAYLDSYSGAPDGPRAPDALYRLGVSLGRLGEVADACRILGEVAARYPGAAVVAQSETEMRTLACR